MRRATAAALTGWMVLGMCGAALATVYVPGQIRSDGIYIRPHFKAAADMVPWIAQVPPPQPGEDGSKAEMRLPLVEIVPPAKKEPPADSR